MRLELSEDQEFFRETTRKFLESETPLTVVRELHESADGFDRGWWRQAAELGWTSMLVPITRTSLSSCWQRNGRGRSTVAESNQSKTLAAGATKKMRCILTTGRLMGVSVTP